MCIGREHGRGWLCRPVPGVNCEKSVRSASSANSKRFQLAFSLLFLHLGSDIARATDLAEICLWRHASDMGVGASRM